MRLMKPLNHDNSVEVRYESAIKQLLDLALDHSHDQARIAADILMSASNAERAPNSKWTVNLSELTELNEIQAYAAMGLIHGRIELHRVPHTMIPNGLCLFKKVWSRWRNVEEW